MKIDRDGEAWTPREDALLGTDSDRVIAAKLGRSSVAISNRRTKLGIARRFQQAINSVPGIAESAPLDSRASELA